ncbi:Required for respiratory growth protein 9, mitochondrial [Penicillium digitatum]|uniref:Required for respiratory growth protein 9, mitochondrial n=3 Tax=Penicillium digitatum TaxID=36651 RepID=K9FRR9_PEND2|nr:Required for respiratory growth protein 9, mitochondrial [Penicillium digitatum Pd1]EKV04068.1 Required for respiratory growth protein 9, mitochondrial [Penicillium digitatum Pd1]EKV05398.1 Required for respiratory growth protein 9, mitochondrial [Penicillium digitatum PHI26]QQK45170.1 Required for respiratory growth protein 9, mitochondrial [Penicillium digitatum]
MATKCAASSRPALPAVLRNVFRSQFFNDSGASSVIPHHRPLAFGRLFISNIQLQQSFSSMARLCDPSSESALAAPETPAVADDIVSLQDKIPKKRDYDSDGKKGVLNNHKRHPKDQRRDPDNTGRTDRERRAFRNETRREAKKHPRKDWQDRAEKVKQISENKGKRKPETWQVQKAALKEKFAGGWNPPKKLSPDALDGIRHLHAKAPEQFTTAVLAEEFEMSPEAIRRILKSKWRPSEDEMESRRKRWENRHDRIWSRMAELGLRPSTNRTRTLSDFHVLYDDNNRERR